MALRRKTEPAALTAAVAKAPQPRAPLVASAAALRLPAAGYPLFPFEEAQLHEELWRLYDSVGEFQFLCDWTGSNTSRARLFVADVDPTGVPQQETKNRKGNFHRGVE